MTHSAELRKCPKCGRKGAIKKHIDVDARTESRYCRWCDYKKFEEF